MWEGVWASACVCAICFCLSFFCACFFAKAEISWLGTIRGDSECKAELFLFVSDISALGHTVLWCACVSVSFYVFSHPADLSPEILCQAFVLIPVHQRTWRGKHCEAALRFFCTWVLKAGRSDPGPHPEQLAKSCYLLYCDSADHQLLSQTFWITLDNGEIGVNNGIRLQH